MEEPISKEYWKRQMSDMKRQLITIWLVEFIERLTRWSIVFTLIVMPIVAAMKTSDVRFLWVEIASTIAACIVGVEKKNAD
jgi:hypothetical protein